MAEHAYIWITQIRSGDAVEIGKLEAKQPAATVLTFRQIQRMQLDQKREPGDLRENDVLVELVVDDDLEDGGPIIKPTSAEWLLGTFLKVTGWKRKLRMDLD